MCNASNHLSIHMSAHVSDPHAPLFFYLTSFRMVVPMPVPHTYLHAFACACPRTPWPHTMSAHTPAHMSAHEGPVCRRLGSTVPPLSARRSSCRTRPSAGLFFLLLYFWESELWSMADGERRRRRPDRWIVLQRPSVICRLWLYLGCGYFQAVFGLF